MQDVGLYIQGPTFDLLTSPEADLTSATLEAYTFTMQKNGHQNEKLVQGIIGDPWCFPINATARHVLLHRHNKATIIIKYIIILSESTPTANKSRFVTTLLVPILI
jgi:hypothetical protein